MIIKDHVGYKRIMGLEITGDRSIQKGTPVALSVVDREIRALLNNYRYGKDLNLLLSKANNFKVSYSDGNSPSVILHNFFNSESNVRQGVCGEVAHSFGANLLKSPKIAARYDVVVVNVSERGLFPKGGHAVILMAPKGLNIRKALETNKNGRFPEGTTLIDPSLGRVIQASSLNKENGLYGLDKGLSTYDEIESSRSALRMELRANDPNPIIIGFLRDYIPTNNKNDNRMLYLTFNTDRNKRITLVGLMAHDQRTNQSEIINLSDYTPSQQTTQLRELLRKINSDLGL